MRLELTTQAGTTVLPSVALTERAVSALIQKLYAGQFVELAMFQVTQLPFADCPLHVRGYVREGGTCGGKVLASLRLHYAA